MEEDTINHSIRQCPKWAQQRGGYLNSFYLSVTETVDTVLLHQIITVETHTNPPLDFTGASTELKLSHMVPPFRLLGGTRFYLTVVLALGPQLPAKKKNRVAAGCGSFSNLGCSYGARPKLGLTYKIKTWAGRLF